MLWRFLLMCVVVAAAVPATLRFQNNVSTSLITAPNQPWTMTQGLISFLPIVVEVVDANGVICQDSTISVRATCDSNLVFQPTQAKTDNGVASFSNVAFHSCPALAGPMVFTAYGGSGGCDATGAVTQTGDITVAPEPNADIEYAASITTEITAVVNIALRPPIVIQIKDSCGVEDATNVGLEINVTTAAGPGAVLGGTTTATVSFGKAIFNDIIFTSVPANGVAVLTFTAGFTTGGLPVEGKFTVSGNISVLATAIPVYGLRFGTSNSFFTVAGQGHAGVLKDTALSPAVMIQIVDSAGNDDLTNSAVVVTASSAGVPLGGTTTARVSKGLATFADLRVTGCPASTIRITFTAGDQGGAATKVAGKTITTGDVAIKGIPNFSIRFAPIPFVTQNMFNASRQARRVSIGGRMRPVVVQMIDSCGKGDNVPSHHNLTVTTSSGRLLGTTSVLFVNGIANISSLQLRRTPRATLEFRVGGMGTVLTGIVIVRQGTVTATPTQSSRTMTRSPTDIFPTPEDAISVSPSKSVEGDNGTDTFYKRPHSRTPSQDEEASSASRSFMQTDTATITAITRTFADTTSMPLPRSVSQSISRFTETHTETQTPTDVLWEKNISRIVELVLLPNTTSNEEVVLEIVRMFSQYSEFGPSIPFDNTTNGTLFFNFSHVVVIFSQSLFPHVGRMFYLYFTDERSNHPQQCVELLQTMKYLQNPFAFLVLRTVVVSNPVPLPPPVAFQILILHADRLPYWLMPFTILYSAVVGVVVGVLVSRCYRKSRYEHSKPPEHLEVQKSIVYEIEMIRHLERPLQVARPARPVDALL